MKIFKDDSKFYLDFRFRDRRFRMTAFKTEKQSQKLADFVERLIDIALNNDVIPQDMQKTLDCLPARIIGKLSTAGMITTTRIAGKNQLSEHRKDFIESLKIKRCSERHIFLVANTLTRICDKCGFSFLSDLDAGRFTAYVNGLNIAVKTKRHYIAIAKQFVQWLYNNGRLSKDKFKLIELPKALQADQRHPRRALTADEVAMLIQAAENGKPFRGVSGRERALIYRLSIETGLRYNEVKTLKISDFDFKAGTVEVRDLNEKARRGAVLPLRKSTADMIKDFLRNKTPQAIAFTLKKGYLMIKTDLEAAGIKYKDENGCFADMHSLRHTTASLLIQSGANPKVVQTIMRHRDINLSLSKYTHLYAGQSRQTIENLPDFVVKQDKAVMTGTDQQPIENQTKNHWPKTAHENTKDLTKPDNISNAIVLRNGNFNGINSKEMAFLESKCTPSFSNARIGATGLEPATFRPPV